MEEARELITALRQAGHSAWLVGGCVRDLLLDRRPKDYDIATSATPAQVLARFPQGIPVGAHFGVVLVGATEIATYRSDGRYSDGRHPDAVTYETNPEADAARRDFTINGLFLDPDTNEVLDFVGGRRDLAEGVIRAIGDPVQRFHEDHLRMLRAVRFAARFGFAIHPPTFTAIQSEAHAIHRIANERVRDELTKILIEGHARRGFLLLDESGLLIHTLPEVAAMKGVEQPAEFHPEGDVWTHTLLLLDGLREPSPELAWAALLHDVGKPPTFRRAADRIRFDGHAELGVRLARHIMNRLHFSNDEMDHVCGMVAHHMDWMNIQKMRASTLKRFLRMPRFDDHLELHRLDCQAGSRHFANYDFAQQKLAELPADALRPTPLLNGHDLIAAGLEPGKAFAQILRAVEDAQLEGRLTNKEEALAFALNWPNAT